MESNKAYPQPLHIGRLIEEQLKRDERSVSWLARQIPCTRNHVYKIFHKPSLDCALLLRISKVMQFNFFQYYTQEVSETVAQRIGDTQTES
ncbi:MAG: XRE family transcriptional regulator [Bacteroidales bacterium]|nr:XRE family transcriptional regulator [Bacteroidales bacterium]